MGSAAERARQTGTIIDMANYRADMESRAFDT